MPATYQREKFADVYDEARPLLERHWREIAHYQDIALDPDVDGYLTIENAGCLRVFTARLDGALIGYVAFFVRPSMHSRTSPQALQDVLFLDPAHRHGRTGIGLIKFCDDELRDEGVHVAYQSVSARKDFGPVLARLGYQPIETTYARRLN